MQSDSIDSAAQAQGESTAAAMRAQERANAQARSDVEPWRLAGKDALMRLSSLLGVDRTYTPEGTRWVNSAPSPEGVTGATYEYRNGQWVDLTGKAPPPGTVPEGYGQITEKGDPNAELNRKFTVADFWADPVVSLGYQFGLDEGRKGLERMAGARGMLNSGSTLKALTKFGTDYAGTQAAGSQARYVGDQTNKFNRLASIAGLGQTAASQSAALGQAGGQNIGSLLTAGGNARGAAAIAQGNAWQNGMQNIGNWWNQQQMIKNLRKDPSIPTPFNPNDWSYGVISPT